MPARRNVLRYKLLFLHNRVQYREQPSSVEPTLCQAQFVVCSRTARALGVRQSRPDPASQAPATAGIQTGRSAARCSVMDQTEKFH